MWRWARRRRKFISIAVVSVVLIAAGAAGYVWWYHQPVVAEVDYGDCEITYGEPVLEWSGDGEEDWNQAGWHYVVREFSLYAESEDDFRPNTIDEQATQMSTGGEDACQDGFDERVDPTEPAYRWQGAQPETFRMGAPGFAEYEARSRFIKHTHPSENLATPVYGHDIAPAAWVADGGSAVAQVDDESLQLWCINDEPCESIVDQADSLENAKRGSGFQYTADACPTDLECHDGWYYGQLGLEDEQFQNGLEPFDLRLNAVSTHAPIIGAAMYMTFAYPADINIETEASATELSSLPGGRAHTDLVLDRAGPALDSLSIDLELDGEYLSTESLSRELTEDQLLDINTQDHVSLPLEFEAASHGGGGCHEIDIEITATSVTGENAHFSGPQLSYCIQQTVLRTYTYSIDTRGSTVADVSEFRRLAAGTLQDQRGWSQANVTFQEVDSGGDFTLWLAAPEEMKGFSAGCSAEYSCRVGPDVIVNDERWRNATDTWNEAGGNIRDYQHMVINHEVGHLLGFGHYDCPAPGDPAPIMQQQSIDLGGCDFNPWPTPMEIEVLESRL